MAQYATVQSIIGQALAIGTDGQARLLKVGDVIALGETVRLGQGASIELLLDDGGSMALTDNQTLVMGADAPQPADAAATGAITAVIQALESGADLSEELEAAAAGLAGGGEGDGSSFVRLLRIVEGVTPLAYDYPIEPREPIREITGHVEPVPEEPGTQGRLALSATPQTVEGGTGITYTVTLDQPALTDMTVILSNGAVVKVLAGETQGSVVVPVQGDDPYIDAETVTATVGAVQGGGFDSLVVDDGAAVTQVLDTDNPTRVSVAITDVDEDAQAAVVTVTLAHPGQTDVTVQTNLGSVLIPKGEVSGTFLVNTADPDVYVDPQSVTVSVTGVAGGNFESIDLAGASATAQIIDTLDATSVTLSAGDVHEDAASVTFTATLSHPGQTDVTVVTSLGNILIPAGQTTGTLVVNTADPDVYKDPSSLTAVVSGVIGGNFEAVDYSAAQATAQITDTVDTTTVSVGGADVDENTASATFTVTLTNPGQTDVVVVTNLGDILIPAGQTSGTLIVDTADPDVYVDPGSVSLNVTGVLGGNFEAVNFDGASLTLQITDTIDTTTVSLSAGSVTEDEPGAVFTATLSQPGQTDVTVVTTQGNILIPAGETTGTLLVNTANPNVYVDPGAVTATVTGVLGGNFEAVSYQGVSATAQVSDTIDTTFLTLGSVTASEGGVASLSASVGAPVTGSDLLITLSNGAAITIPVGESAGTSSPFTVANAEDPYVDAGSYSVGVQSFSGGNYEFLNTASTGTVHVNDTIDPSIITLGDVTAFEGGVAQIQVSVGAPVTGSDLLVTLTNGATVTIPVGQSSGVSTEFAVTNAEDPYVDAGSYEVGIQSVSGGNYEQLTLTDTALVSVDDTPTPVYVTVTTSDVPETATSAVFHVQMSEPPVAAATARVSVGGASYDVALAASGAGELVVPFSDDDVYVDEDTLTATVTGVSGGGYEQVSVLGASATALIYDVDDTTAFTLGGPGTVDEGGAITYTVVLDHPVQGSPVTVLLSNGEQVQIPVGGSSGSVTVQLDEGVYSVPTVTITGHVGGNYEAVAYVGSVSTDVDSEPGDAQAAMALAEGAAASGVALLTFATGADALDPATFRFANPSVAAPTVSGLAGGESLNWALLGNTLQATTSGGDTLVLTLSGATANSVYVTATLNGNVLHAGDSVTVGNVAIEVNDTDGDLAQGIVNLTIADVTPSVVFTSVVASTTTPGDVYTGQWTANQSVDATLPVVNAINVLGATVDGQPATATLTNYNPNTGLGSGTLTTSSLSIPFNFTLNADGTYAVQLAEATKQIIITQGDYTGSTPPSGPVTEYVITYYDAATQTTVTATASSVPAGTPVTLVGFGATPGAVTTFNAVTTGGGVNASSDGIGVSSNVLESYVTQSGNTTEALRYNPSGQVGSVTLEFTGQGANAFGGSKTDVLYITVRGEAAGQTQTILLDSRYGDFIVNANGTLTPITSTPYAGQTALQSYTIPTPEGWTSIADVEVTPGFHTDGDKTYTTDLKLGFGFTTTATVTVDMPVQIDFQATVTDADGDPATSLFSLVTYTGNAITGTGGADLISGTEGMDTVQAGAGDDLLLTSTAADVLSGGEGQDTVAYSLAAASMVVDLGTGTASTLEGGSSVTDTLSSIENVTGSAFDDVITGGAGSNVLDGGLGDDVLAGAGGFDTASYASAGAGVTVDLGGQGDATPDTFGGAGSDTLSSIEGVAGSDFSDDLRGDAGGNTISGGAGDDLITGGLGDDVLTGGEGSDTFDYNEGEAGHDVITDFTLAHVDDGGDSLDFTDMLTGDEFTPESLADHLSFASNGNGGTIIGIHPSGVEGSAPVQTISLENVSLLDLQAYAGSDSEVEIIRKLLDNGNLRNRAG